MNTVSALLALGLAAALLQADGQKAATGKEAHMSATATAIPESVRSEHQAIHEQLEEAMRAPGQVGVAARALGKVLHPHFVREEEIALPPLALLAPLVRERFRPEWREVLPMTDALAAELPRMLREHGDILAATDHLQAVALEEESADVARLAEQLKLHARAEEEVFYPAAILVGELVRLRAAAQ